MINDELNMVGASEAEVRNLAESIYDYVNNNGTVTRYKINKFYMNKDNSIVSAAINLLIQEDALEYCPSGIKMGSKPLIVTSDASVDGGIGVSSIRRSIESVEVMSSRIEAYIETSGQYHPIDEIGHRIESMPDSMERDVLRKFFLCSDAMSEDVINDKRLNGIIKGFCNSFHCDESDVQFFTNYFMPSNLFRYVFNRPLSYYRMMCLKYEQGSTSPELLLNYADCEDVIISLDSKKDIQLFERFKQFTKGYMEFSNQEPYISFMECYLFLLNDYSVGVGSIDYLAYKMHDLNSNDSFKLNKNHASFFDDFITTTRSVKYLSLDNIDSVLLTLNDAYSGCAITPEKIFKKNSEMLFQFYVEDLVELKQVLKKYGLHTMNDGYICFDTDLETAIFKFARETNCFEWSKISKSFVRRYGGDTHVISGYAKSAVLKFEDAGSKELMDDQYNRLIEEFKGYSWTSKVNAQDVFKYKCDCGDLFSNYNMHRLGFSIDGDAYYLTKYNNLRDCMRETVFTGDDFFVDRGFIVNMDCRSFKREVEYLITNLMWIPVAESRYVNLRSDRYDSLYRAIKRCKPIIEEMCRVDFMTAYKLKKNGTGIEYIDNDDFEIVFYDALLMATSANRNSISGQKAYHYSDGTAFGAAGFIKHMVNMEGGESDVASIRSILGSEYGISVDESYTRCLINRSGCILFKETDMVYENETAYKGTKINE